VIFPLAAPGFVAGASLVFVKVFDDLGTPLVMGQTNLLAPQAYLRITQVGLEDPLGYVISVIMIVFSIAAMALSRPRAEGPRLQHAAKGRRQHPAPPAVGRPASVAAYAWIGVMLLLTLSPHIGVLLLSFAQVWSFSPAARRLHAGALRHRVCQTAAA
jgi:iron(III) transport system permease protein